MSSLSSSTPTRKHVSSTPVSSGLPVAHSVEKYTNVYVTPRKLTTMNTTDLRKALNEGVVLFEFIKRDGSLRHARGTTSQDLIPTENMPQNKRSPQQQAAFERQVVTFYDIDRKGWRSMRIDTIWNFKRALKLV